MDFDSYFSNDFIWKYCIFWKDESKVLTSDKENIYNVYQVLGSTNKENKYIEARKVNALVNIWGVEKTRLPCPVIFNQ